MTTTHTDLAWPTTDTDRTPTPMSLFGKDHWATFAQAEAAAFSNHGLLAHDQLRCNTRRHPVFMAAKTFRLTDMDASRFPTRLKDSAEPGPDGRYGTTNLTDHDDYDCLGDLVAAGLLVPVMPAASQHGAVFFDAYGHVVKDKAGDPIRPDFVTGLAEAWLATRAQWTLTDLGRQVAGQLRAHKAAGGAWHHFTPQDVTA